MSRWHLALFVLLSTLLANPCGASPSSLGPTSTAEGVLLWKEGKAAFQSGRYQIAVNHLQRFVDRYPGAEGYVEAHRLLGISYLKLNEPEKSLPVLRDFVSRSLDLASATLGKVALGKAFLATGKYDEAYLLSLEFEKPQLKDAKLKTEGLLLKALASAGQGQDDRASRALDSAKKMIQGHENPELNGALLVSELKIRDQICGRLPSAGKMDEAQARDQLARRGVCLTETVLTYKDTLSRVDEVSMKLATLELFTAYRNYVNACSTPPQPTPLTPKDRTPEQLRKYQEELVEVLRADCKKELQLAVDTLGMSSGKEPTIIVFKPGVPRKSFSLPVRQQLVNFSDSLEKMAREKLTKKGSSS